VAQTEKAYNLRQRQGKKSGLRGGGGKKINANGTSGRPGKKRTEKSSHVGENRRPGGGIVVEPPEDTLWGKRTRAKKRIVHLGGGGGSAMKKTSARAKNKKTVNRPGGGLKGTTNTKTRRKHLSGNGARLPEKKLRSPQLCDEISKEGFGAAPMSRSTVTASKKKGPRVGLEINRPTETRVFGGLPVEGSPSAAGNR